MRNAADHRPDEPEDAQARDPERLLALHYAREDVRGAVGALFDLDRRLGHVLRGGREPLVTQMRLTWWHDALVRLDSAAAPAEPVLQALQAELLPRGIGGARLAGMIDGWEALIDADLAEDATLERHARLRGVALFAAAGQVLGVGPADPVAPAGRGWALADLARNLGDAEAAGRAAALARAPLAAATRARWSRAGRSLGALAHLARMDLAVPRGRALPVGAPRRVLRLAWHRLSGR